MISSLSNSLKVSLSRHRGGLDLQEILILYLHHHMLLDTFQYKQAQWCEEIKCSKHSPNHWPWGYPKTKSYSPQLT